MKDLLSKEHYCYQIHTLLMKISAYPPPLLLCRQPPYMDYPPFLQEHLDPSIIFQKFQPPVNKGEFTLWSLLV